MKKKPSVHRSVVLCDVCGRCCKEIGFKLHEPTPGDYFRICARCESVHGASPGAVVFTKEPTQ